LISPQTSAEVMNGWNSYL